jgi:6-phosphogluconolactonase
VTNERRVLVHDTIDALAWSAAARFYTKLTDILDDQDIAHISLTGGTVGTRVLQSIASSPSKAGVDWTRVHFWWSDERFVPRASEERNEGQARAALLDLIEVPEENIHPMPSTDDYDDLDAAAEAYAAELAEHSWEDLPYPPFDITFLGVGPDGHIASLFPDKSGVLVRDRVVIPVRNSPKPPPERLSLTLPVINASKRVWMVLAGPDKASALGLALAGAELAEVPVAGVKGRKRTVFFVDRDAARDVPENLFLSAY